MQRLHLALARVRGFVQRAAPDAEFDEELEAHLAMAVEDKVRRGMPLEEARRSARLELGGLGQLREEARAARGLPSIDRFWLDLKLGARMLRKSWGLTLVGGVAMAITIGLGASIFTIYLTVTTTTLPLPDGERIVAIQQSDASTTETRDSRLTDFARWRETLRSIEEVSAARFVTRDIMTPERGAVRVATAEMTASAFRVALVSPLLGRTLTDDDERDGAAPVVVIDGAMWRTAFSSDPDIIGRRVLVDAEPHTIVGVMPEEFRFPINHWMWVPLHASRAAVDPVLPRAFVFGRLARGFTLDGARAEAITIGMLPDDQPSEGAPPHSVRVVPYAAGLTDGGEAGAWVSGVVLFLVALLLVPPCANIAILIYARTVARREEFAARHALGATRARIVAQIFLEVLVLSSVAAAVGYLLSRQFAFGLFQIVAPGVGSSGVPFWMEFRPSSATLFGVVLLAIVAAAIAGGWPALQATGRWKQVGLNALGQRGSAVRLGTTWTLLLSVQVALSLAAIPSGAQMALGLLRPVLSEGVGTALEELILAQLVPADDLTRLADARSDVIRQLRDSPGVSGAALSSVVPMAEPLATIDVEGLGRARTTVGLNYVDASMFDVFGARFMAGHDSEYGPSSNDVVVNRSFVEDIFDDGEPLGRRVRFSPKDRVHAAGEANRWFQIVGVVDNFPAQNEPPTMYRPLAVPDAHAVLVVRGGPDGGLTASRLREIIARHGSTLRLGVVRSLADVHRERSRPIALLGALMASVLIIVLLFSVAGVHTLMVFTVVQRWREIGLRAGLGAQPRTLVAEIFGRALRPVIAGAVAGAVIALFIDAKIDTAAIGGIQIRGIVPASAVLMCLVGVLALVGPARRALRIDPAVALRDG
jgi:putative ABC transport system permease protein